MHLGIGVEEQQVLPAGLFRGEVDCAGEADVLGQGEEARLGKFLRHHLSRSVSGCVFDDECFEGGVSGMLVKGPEAGASGLPAVIRDDENRDVDAHVAP